MSYKQRDAHFGDENNLKLVWNALTVDLKDQILKATIPYEKADSSRVEIVIIRKNGPGTHPVDYNMRAEIVTEAIQLAGQGSHGLEFMFVTGADLKWEEIKEEAKPLPSNRLNILTRTDSGNSFIGATSSDQIGMLLYKDDKWRVLVVNDAAAPVFSSPVKVLCTI